MSPVFARPSASLPRRKIDLRYISTFSLYKPGAAMDSVHRAFDVKSFVARDAHHTYGALIRGTEGYGAGFGPPKP